MMNRVALVYWGKVWKINCTTDLPIPHEEIYWLFGKVVQDHLVVLGRYDLLHQTILTLRREQENKMETLRFKHRGWLSLLVLPPSYLDESEEDGGRGHEGRSTLQLVFWGRQVSKK